jgi:hypothetical protein
MRTSTTILETLGRESTHPVWACLNLWNRPIVPEDGGVGSDRAGSGRAGGQPVRADRGFRA